jgi:hypothetical protein
MPCEKSALLLLYSIHPHSAVIVDVDLERPERNGDVVIFSLNNVEHVDHLYHCVSIFLSVDVRDVAKEGSFTATLVSETEILITMPSLTFALYRDSEQRNERLKRIDMHDPQLQLSQNIVINQIRDGPNRPIKKLLLRFPEGIIFGNVFHPSSAGMPSLEEEIQWDHTTTTIGAYSVPCTTCFLVWKVADLATSRRFILAERAEAPRDVLERLFATALTE